MWSPPNVHSGITIPQWLYPAFAPLPVPFAQYLVLQEYRRQYRIAKRKQPTPAEPPVEVFWQAVLGRVRDARAAVFEGMHAEVVNDARDQAEGKRASFPDVRWLLNMLAERTPVREEPKEFTARTFENWVNRGLLTRGERGTFTFEKTSVAAFLTARISEEFDEVKWLPTKMSVSEPRWWCYGQTAPETEIVSVPVPLPDNLPSSMILWTPWAGAVWDEGWQMRDSVAYRWSPTCPSEEAVAAWDKEMLSQIQEALQHVPFSKQAVRDILLVEARKILLERYVFPLEMKEL